MCVGVAAQADGRARSGDSAQIQIVVTVPLVCGAEISSFHVETQQPLVIDATVRQACNGDHEMTVSYDPASVTDVGALSLSYGGRAPTRASLGSAGFGTEHHTDAVRTLRIVYNGGSASQRDQFARTVAIAVSPR